LATCDSENESTPSQTNQPMVYPQCANWKH
jgi:hypothetical protein